MLIFFLGAVAIGVLMRIEQLTISPPLFAPQTYNAFFTVHGVIMIFFVAMPIVTGLMNYVVPLQIGARSISSPTCT
jgi:heme/copper-type cytochrome/quinol oxidase subunit 1